MVQFTKYISSLDDFNHENCLKEIKGVIKGYRGSHCLPISRVIFFFVAFYAILTDCS